jgi:thioredoxin-like negative regulator of GroEL
MKFPFFHWISLHLAQQTKARRFWYSVIASAILLLGVATGLWFSGPLYGRWKFRRLLKETDVFLQKEDYRSATLAAQQLMSLQPGRSDGYRIMADLERGRQSSLEIYWRRQVTGRAPNSAPDLLSLAEAYLRSRQPETAKSILETIAGPITKTAAFFAAQGEAAVATGNSRDAEQDFASALRADPGNAEYSLKLASLHMRSPDLFVRTRGRQEAEALIQQPQAKREALEALTEDAVRWQELARAERFSRQLAKLPEATFQDRLVLLDLLQHADPGEAAPLLKSMLDRAASVPAEAQQLTSWMIRNSEAEAARRWLDSLDPAMKLRPELLMAQAECAVARQDWRDLPGALRIQDWGSFDFLRLAYTARAQRGLGQNSSAASTWGAAVSEATPSPNALTMLSGLTIEWKWKTETENLLWLSLTRYPWSADAASRLFEICRARGDSVSLRRLFGLVLGGSPEDMVSRNNFTFLSLLLGEGLATAHDAAAKLYQADSTTPGVVSTYAFSLYLQGHFDQAKKVMDTLPEAEREKPTRAGYYALILKALGQTNAAASYAAMADAHAEELLPEERALFRTVTQEKQSEPAPSSKTAGDEAAKSS